jgi:hypothetical protein
VGGDERRIANPLLVGNRNELYGEAKVIMNDWKTEPSTPLEDIKRETSDEMSRVRQIGWDYNSVLIQFLLRLAKHNGIELKKEKPNV